MAWKKIADEFPPDELKEVLCWANPFDDEKFAICEVKSEFKQVRCMDNNIRDFLYVKNSIAPGFCGEDNGHWMPIPQDWIAYSVETYRNGDWTEVLIKLFNGNIYCGYIHSLDWAPSFNAFRYGHLESIEAWQPLPDPPKIERAEALN